LLHSVRNDTIKVFAKSGFLGQAEDGQAHGGGQIIFQKEKRTGENFKEPDLPGINGVPF